MYPTRQTASNPVLCTFLALACVVPLGCRSVQLAMLSPDTSSPRVASSDADSTAVSDSESLINTIPSESRWPARWGNNPDQPGTIVELEPSLPMRPSHLSRFSQHRTTDIEYSDANKLAADIGITTGFRFKPEGPGSFLFLPNPENTPDINADPIQDSGTLDESNHPDLSFKFVSASHFEKRTASFIVNEPELSAQIDPSQDHVVIQRTWFTYKDPASKNNESVEPEGTIVLLPGMFGTPAPIVNAFERYWTHQGFSVLRMRSQPSRFSEHELIRVIPGEEQSASLTAAISNDQRVSEGAYATKAALDHVLSKREILTDKPVILVGMSGGAMMLPTVYAYAPDSYDASVLIAGGADFLTIAVESNYKSWIDALVFDFNIEEDDAPHLLYEFGKPAENQLDTLSSFYLQHSKLDAYHTATEMTDIPVLMLHAKFDQAVPSSTGDLLYQQLNQPERWSYPLGHELIFAGLPTQVTRIHRWLDKHVFEAD